MRITYTRDHFQRSYIIQIVIDDPDIIGLPLSVNINPNNFLSLSTQLLYLATVVKELETASDQEEEQNMFDADTPDLEEEEEVEEEEEETEDSEYPDTEGEDIAEGELDEEEEVTDCLDEDEEEEEDDSITQSEGEEDE